LTGHFITSERFNTIFGLPLNVQPTYENALSRIREDHRNKIAEAIDTAIRDKTNFNVEYPVKPEDQIDRWVRSVGKAVTNEQGITYITGVIADITEQKLDDARKNDFIGMVSHELKTPLTSLTAIIQVAGAKLRFNEDPFLTGAMQKATALTKRMSVMINGFLNISRLELGKIIIAKQEFKVYDLIKEVVEEFLITSSKHAIEINDCDDVSIIADRDKIASVLSNLLSNAVKYSPKQAKIIVDCKMTDKEATISVRDQGIGIAADDLKRIFDRYYRVESSKTNTLPGLVSAYISVLKLFIATGVKSGRRVNQAKARRSHLRYQLFKRYIVVSLHALIERTPEIQRLHTGLSLKSLLQKTRI
jgi:two-component system sensor histidine kinase VicK